MRIFGVLLVFAAFLCVSCGGKTDPEPENHVVMSLGKIVSSLDPVLCADIPGQSICAALYDTLLQYRYGGESYALEPAMLEKIPVLSADGKNLRCTLRDDLYFQEAPPFRSRAERKVTSRDVAFSLMRLADARLRSPCYWIVRGRIAGMTEFHALTGKAAPGDMKPYDAVVPGIRIIDDRNFELICEKAEPRLMYLLALPNCAVVSRTAAEFYGAADFAEKPCGSGPFRLVEWNRDYSIIMERNPDFREEYFKDAEDPEMRKKRLPFADRITCFLVRQPVSSWLMFLQGELDFYALDDDHFQSIVDTDMKLADALAARGIRLSYAPQMETNYIGFNFSDPVLGGNPDLRRAISLAFDKDLRVMQSGGRFTKAYGPVPPGLPGSLGNEKGPFGEKDLVRAKEYLAKAGYPGGIDPKTGEPLVLTFDQPGTDVSYQQIAELMDNDLRAIGIAVKSNLNTRPRFQAKLASGDLQLFRYSWVADYPDAENFLQLFYSPNAGGSNRASYRNAAYDPMFRKIETLPDSPERTEKMRAMSRFLLEDCPWIFETHTMAFAVCHSWLKNFQLHDFALNRWKYLSAPVKEREEIRRTFRPLRMSELR